MAERRMFAKTIVTSGKFLKMPPTARLLYYDLGMAADDDGVVEAYTTMVQTRANEDDLRVLISKGYVRLLNEDLVAQIMDWNINNSIRSDRYHPSIYKDLVLQIGCDDNQVTTKWQPSDNQMETEVRLGKDSIGKDRLGKDSLGKTSKGNNKTAKAVVYYPNDEILNSAFSDYVEMRKKIKAPMTEKAIELAISKLEKLSNGDNDKAVEILEQSIMNSWKGLFPIGGVKQEKARKPYENPDGTIDWSKV